jgi:alkanesulfonate monooxygenase SsuD/methylene tetrahydromethanopterin reductase-like flavin-dependent oxidoreductase (luciferase family)
MKEETLDFVVGIPDDVIETIGKLLEDYKELADLIPEWNGFERDKICEKISSHLGDLLIVKDNLKI